MSKSQHRRARSLTYAFVESYGLVFIPIARAHELVTIWRALQTSRTWADFLGALPAEDRSAVTRRLTDAGAEIPAAASCFRSDDVPGVADGDWPGFPAQEMLEDGFLPQSVVNIGSVRDTVLNGPYLELSRHRQAEILALLRADHYEVAEDRALVFAACGLEQPS